MVRITTTTSSLPGQVDLLPYLIGGGSVLLVTLVIQLIVHKKGT